MRVIVQRVKEASVHVDGDMINHIGVGYLLLVGLKKGDRLEDIEYMAKKIKKLRIFSDQDDKMNLNINQVNGQVLSISQFTIYGDARKQNRPGFTRAMPFKEAEVMYAKFNQCMKDEGLDVKDGVFGGNMKVSLINDGPVTLILDTDE